MKNIGNTYSWQGLLIVTVLLLAGIIILLCTGIHHVTNFNQLYYYFYVHGFTAIISMFFVLVGLYCWYLFFTNIIIKPKEEIMYLCDFEGEDLCSFVDKKGKKYFYESKDLDLYKFYLVLKTKDKIDKIIGISIENFEIPKEKQSYWLNLYLQGKYFENIFLLPIVYVLFLPGLLSFIMSKGFQKIYGALFMTVPLYVIINDLIYKIKNKNL